MASRVRILPEDLANRIAAGEVVERPASVVKELLENSLDAGAGDVRVEVTGGGTLLVRVTDNGVGMSREDARLCLERHATSKLPAGSDLLHITTLGFRGEALPSIASVSRMRLVTREPESETGCEVRVEGGRVTEILEAGCAAGTSIEVEDLFFNTPVRRKFLRREGTESSYVAEGVLRLALSRPEVGFRLSLDAREVLDAPPAASLPDRLLSCLGRDVARDLHRVDGLAGEIAIHGYVSQPGRTRSTAAGVHLFVNSRPIRDRSLTHAVARAYGTLLQSGRYPIAVLFLEMPLEQVDVNVHPTKAEVRFREPRAAFDAVLRTVTDTIRAAPWTRITRGNAVSTPPEREYGQVETTDPGVAEGRATPIPGHGAPGGSGEIFARVDPEAARPAQRALQGMESLFGEVRIVGFFRSTYIVCESKECLLLVDQHAAHERVLFEELSQRHAGAGVASQGLLHPQTLDLSPDECAFALAHAAELGKLGFAVESFGTQSLLVRSHPVVLKDAHTAQALRDVLGEMRVWEGSERTVDARSAAFARIACHAAFRSGDALSTVDAEAILARLSVVDTRSHCPHGRPLAIEWPLADIERRLGRR